MKSVEIKLNNKDKWVKEVAHGWGWAEGEGWVTRVKDKIKEKTGKWERLLLKGNRGRR